MTWPSEWVAGVHSDHHHQVHWQWRSGQLTIHMKTTSDLLIGLLQLTMCQRDGTGIVPKTEFRNRHHLFKPGKSIRQTCLSIFYTHPPCLLQTYKNRRRMQLHRFPFDDGINVSVSHLRFNYPPPLFDKSSSEDDINTSHNHTNIYPANALLMSHPIPGINSFPLLWGWVSPSLWPVVWWYGSFG